MANVNFDNEKIIPIELTKEMEKSYIDYAMSVIVGRALPDVRDGLKPVHRRILFTMFEAGYTPDQPYKKCAATVGDVLGKYHPHGDAAVYDSLVRMAQDFSLRYPLIDGHGNFGSVDGDPPAAYRYTEARISKIAVEMLRDINKETVDFIPNYNEERQEPVVIPSRMPNLLVNGSAGIAVGMTTNIPPHNLCEVIDGIIAIIDNPECTIDQLCEVIHGPDFPTGALIMGRSGIRAAYHTGRGRVVMRAKTAIEVDDRDRQAIIVNELPYQVNKARLIEKMAEQVRDKIIDGISALRDESDRDGMRIVVELKRDANATVVLNQLFKHTQMQETFGIIMLALVGNQPKILNLREILDLYIDFQKDIIERRTRYDLRKAEKRAHILEGLRVALDNIDEVISIIRSSYDDAKLRLMERFSLSDIQSQAILDMRLIRLQGLERKKIDEEFDFLMEQIEEFKRILGDVNVQLGIIKDELKEIKEKYGDGRRSSIENVADEIDLEDLIEEQENCVTLTHFGYIKRLASNTYKAQRRGGRGVTGLSTRQEDYVSTLITTSTHSHLLFFTNLGKMYKLKTYQIPEAGRQAKGTPIVNLLELDADEKVTAAIALREFTDDTYFFMTTRKGIVKKTAANEYESARKKGLIAIRIDEGDELIDVSVTSGNDEILIATNKGMAVHFSEEKVRSTGRQTRGVAGINLQEGDIVVGVAVAAPDDEVLIVSEFGYGKKARISDFRLTNRAAKGTRCYKFSEKTGLLCGLVRIEENEDCLLITDSGTIIRMNTSNIRTMRRQTLGVRLMRLGEDVRVVSIATSATEEAQDESHEETQVE